MIGMTMPAKLLDFTFPSIWENFHNALMHPFSRDLQCVGKMQRPSVLATFAIEDGKLFCAMKEMERNVKRPVS